MTERAKKKAKQKAVAAIRTILEAAKEFAKAEEAYLKATENIERSVEHDSDKEVKTEKNRNAETAIDQTG